MHASIRKYKVDPSELDEVTRSINETFVPRVEGTPGFVAYHVVDCGNGIVTTVTVGEDEGAVDRSAELAVQFVQEDLADMSVERVEAQSGEIIVTHTG